MIQVPGHIILCPDFSQTGPSGSTRNSPNYPATSNFPDYPAARNLPDYPATTETSNTESSSSTRTSRTNWLIESSRTVWRHKKLSGSPGYPETAQGLSNCDRSALHEIRAPTDCRLPASSAAPPSKRQLPWATLEIPPVTPAISRAFVTPGELFSYSLFRGGAVFLTQPLGIIRYRLH